MSETSKHEMALDLLRCHLGMSNEEALAELGLKTNESVEEQVARAQAHLLSNASQ